jgi:pyruvate/2-oxoacid:ferredoxin oxidoreductase alpha subunit
MNKQLIKGNEAVVYGALLGGATHFFGYPITPASEIVHAAASYFPAAGRFFLQAESEVSAINMLYGAACAGARVMTASSGPGVSLMAEGISYCAGVEIPCVIVDIQRAGPGLGNIWPEQSDYNCVVKGGSHGCYKNLVLAPATAQEMCDFTYRAFELAEKYRITVFILSDAYIGQIMEPVSLPTKVLHGSRNDWAVYGDAQSRHNLFTSIHMNQIVQSDHNINLQEKYLKLTQEISEFEEVECNDADYLFVAYGISARVCLSALKRLRAQGIRAGLFRPITLFPFPEKELRKTSQNVNKIIVVELSNGQMADDVERMTGCTIPVLRYNWYGGTVPSTEELIEKTIHDTAGVTV